MRRAPGPLRHLDEPVAVGRVLRARHQEDVAVGRDRPHRVLAVLRGIADIVGRRAHQSGEPLPQHVHHLGDIVKGQRGLGHVGGAVGIGEVDGRRLLGRRDQPDVGQLAHRALDLVVVGVADEDHAVVAGGEAAHFAVHLGDQGARGVDDGLVAPLGFGLDGGRHSVGREHQPSAHRRLVDLVDEDGAAGLQIGHHVAVVDDLAPDVHGRAVAVEGPLDHLDRPLDASAERPRLRHQHGARCDGRGPRRQFAGGAAQRPIGTQASRQRRRRPRVIGPVVGLVDHDLDDGERTRGGGLDEPGGLVVDGERALGLGVDVGTSGGLDAEGQEWALVDAQPRTGQRRGDKRGGGNRHGPQGPPHLGRDHHVARANRRPPGAADTGDGDGRRALAAGGEVDRRAPRAFGAEPGDDRLQPRGATRHGPGLGPPRCEDERRAGGHQRSLPRQ